MIGVVIGREYRERVRSKAFILATVFTVLIFGSILVIPSILADDDEPTLVGYTSEAGHVMDVAQALDEVQATEGLEDDPDAMPELTIEAVVLTDRADAEQAVASGEVDLAMVDASTALVPREGIFASSGVPGVVRQAARVVALEEVVADTGITNDELTEILGAGLIEVESLEGEAVDESRTIIAYAGMMLTYVALLMYGTWMLLGVTEEKSSRVVEIVVATIRPATLLTGKVIGIGLVALTQLVLIFVFMGGLLYAMGLRTPDDLGGAGGGALGVTIDDISIGSVLMLVLWFVVGFSIYNVLFAAVGSLVSRVEDAQNANIPLSLSVVGSLVLSISTLGNPSGTVAIIGTYIPFSAPFVVPVRYALESIAGWEILLSLGISLVTFYLLTRLAGRIYEGAILRAGGRVKIREAWRGDR